MPFFDVSVKTKGVEKYGKMNQEGIFQTEKVKADSIDLFFGFTPERYSSFPTPGDNNYFEFRIEPWIAEMFVENLILDLSTEGLTGPHPLLKGDTFLYEKVR